VSAAFDAVVVAKALLRLSRTAALATLDRAAGAPLTTLVAMAADVDGSPLLLLSTLAEHTRNIAVDARMSLLIATPPRRGDPLNHPRLTLGGVLAPHPDGGARQRYLARNPKAKLYAGFADFSLYRLQVLAVHFNGGFARAAPMSPAELLIDTSGAEALRAAETELLAEINAREPAYRAALAGAAAARRGANWRAISLDPEGLDLSRGATFARASLPAPAKTPQHWRTALEALAVVDGFAAG
jgi:putative heme iron utilization protein